MALAIITTLVVLPLILLVVDLLRPARKEPARYAGPPTGKQRPVPAFVPQAHVPTPEAQPAEALVATLPPALLPAEPAARPAPSAVRAPIGAAQNVSASLAPIASTVAMKLPEPHLEQRPAAPSSLLAGIPATAGVAPAVTLPPHRTAPAPVPAPAAVAPPAAVAAVQAATVAVDAVAEIEQQAAIVHAAFATLAGETPEQIDAHRRRRGFVSRPKKGPLAPTGGRRDYFGDGLLAGTVARRTDAA